MDSDVSAARVLIRRFEDAQDLEAAADALEEAIEILNDQLDGPEDSRVVS